MSSLITSFADIESKEIQWLWNPYIALEKLTLAYGTEEADMTDFMLRFTAALSTGGTGEPPCSILYFDSEMNAGWIKSKLQAYKADLTTISCLLDTGLAALLKAKDEISRAHIRGIIINGLERLLFTKKAMKASEIRNLSAAELDAKLAELKDELFKLRFQQAVNQLDNPMRIKAVKKDIARIKTIQTDIELHGTNA